MKKKSKRTRNFFELTEPYVTVTNQSVFFDLMDRGSKAVSNVLYEPNRLEGSIDHFRKTVKGCTFTNVSFTRTNINSISFYDCTFKECLFIDSKIEDCDFHQCKFIDTNTHKIEFLRTYIDPQSFDSCLNAKSDQNIGTHLYQRLMNNSNNENQAMFGSTATFKFNVWKMRQSFYEARKDWRKNPKNPKKAVLAAAAGIGRCLWVLSGAGVHLGRFAGTFAFILLVVSAFNYCLRGPFGLSKITDFHDAFYFTVITLTTIGYGDITPTSRCGQIWIAAEGLLGFFLFALAASIAFRRLGT